MSNSEPAPVRPGLAAKAREVLLRATGRWTLKTKWDTQHARGQWDYLVRLNERARYSILAGYAQALLPEGRLLDVGCGAGILRERLHPRSFSEYVGIDFGEAVARAAHLADDRTTFLEADMHEFVADRPFERIVFNESFYYFKDPVAGLRRYSQFLTPGGYILTSTHISGKDDEVWPRIAAGYDVVDEVLIANRDGTSWICRAMQPR